MADSDFTVKEMVRELMDKVDSLSLGQNTSTNTLLAINQHLAQLNSKVATHERRIAEHNEFKTKVTIYATIIASTATLIINKLIP